MYDITFYIFDLDDQLQGTFEYNTDLFKESTIERLSEQFAHLLEQVTSNPQLKISELALLKDQDRQQLLIDWNATEVAYSTESTIVSLFEQQVTQTPDAIALVVENQSLTYSDLNQRANQLAHYLRRNCNVNSDTLVGIYAQRSLEMVISLLGVLKAGGAYLPLDPDYPQERITFMLEDAKPCAVLTQHALLGSLSYEGCIKFCVDRNWNTSAQRSKCNPQHITQPDHLAYCIYTSGSTGKPKGVQIEHQSVCNFLRSMQELLNISSQDAFLSLTSLSFDIAVLELMLPLVVGARVVLAPRQVALDNRELLKLIASENISVLQGTPAGLQVLTNNKTLIQPTSLKKILSGGEKLSVSLAKDLKSIAHEVWNLYGPTECTVWSTAHRIDDSEITPSIGRPIANTSIYILDEQLHPVPIGIPGELHIGGAGLARSYLNRTELTAEKFIDNPFGEGRIYKSGDLARYLEDGTIEYIGRIDHQVKVRGFRIELGEIEAALLALPDIQEAVVIAREDTPGDTRLVAYMVTNDASFTTDTTRSALRTTLPEYMLPNVFVTLDALPLTPNGKVDRKALPQPDMQRPELTGEYVAPRTSTEQQLAQLWKNILQIDQVGIYDDFFGLGGHSLLVTQLVSRIRQTFAVELPLRNLFEATTIELQSNLIKSARRNSSEFILPDIEKIDRTQHLPLSFAQQRLWLLDQLEPDNAFYNLASAVRLRGPFNIEALEKSINFIIARHESLRTVFPSDQEGQVLQVIADELLDHTACY